MNIFKNINLLLEIEMRVDFGRVEIVKSLPLTDINSQKVQYSNVIKFLDSWSEK